MKNEEPPVLNDFDRLCQNTFEMFDQVLISLNEIKNLAAISPDTARRIHIRLDDGILTIPMMLREVRRDVEWLEKFYQRSK